jgi:hypothetical protein
MEKVAIDKHKLLHSVQNAQSKHPDKNITLTNRGAGLRSPKVKRDANLSSLRCQSATKAFHGGMRLD